MRQHRDTFLHVWKAALVAAIVAGSAAKASGQVPGSPVLQNAFANPGLAVAANVTGGAGQSFFGAAAGYGLGSGRLQVSGAAGVQRSNAASRGAYGGRLAATVWRSAGQSLGAGAFAGVGGAARTRDAASDVTNPAVLIVPLGITVGYRRPLGVTRGISAYVSPLYRWTRAQAQAVTTSGSMAVAIGADLSISQSFGATLGAELGKASGTASGRSSTFGVALSFVPGR